MSKKLVLVLTLVILLALAAFAPMTTAQTVTLRMLWYNDGNEGEVMRDLLDRFEEDSGIRVEIDTVAFADLHNILQAQLEAGNEAPDIARVADTARFREFYLDMTDLLADPAYWEANFAEPVLNSFRKGPDDTGIYGFPSQFTITGPFINATLFEQAGVDIPGPEATWFDWTEASTEVAEATGTPYAIAIDRTGHRFWGPALTNGATFVNADGSMTVDSEGFRATAELLIDWHESGITPVEVWVGSGDQYASARDYFVNGQLVMYMSGSWQVQAFSNDIGESFDWRVVPNPSGVGGSTGIPGGAVIGAMKTTSYPAEVAQVMDYLVREDVLAEFTARTLFIPGHIGIAEAGVAYETDNPDVLNALNVFLAEVPKLSNEAYALQYSPIGFTLNTNIRDRLTQVIVGELTLDQAIERIQEEVDAAFAAQ